MDASIEEARQRLREAQQTAIAAAGNVEAAKAALDRADAMHAELQAEHDRLAEVERIEVSAGAYGLVAAIKSGLMQRPAAPSDEALKAKMGRAEAEHRISTIVEARRGLAAEHEATIEAHKRAENAVRDAVNAVMTSHALVMATTLKTKSIELRDLAHDLQGIGMQVREGSGVLLDASMCAAEPLTIRAERTLPSVDWSGFHSRLISDAEAQP